LFSSMTSTGFLRWLTVASSQPRNQWNHGAKFLLTEMNGDEQYKA
jgi:hypothetical protein